MKTTYNIRKEVKNKKQTLIDTIKNIEKLTTKYKEVGIENK